MDAIMFGSFTFLYKLPMNVRRAMCEEVVANNPKPVADFKAGKEKALTSLVGQVMKASKGKANPALVNKLLRELLA